MCTGMEAAMLFAAAASTAATVVSATSTPSVPNYSSGVSTKQATVIQPSTASNYQTLASSDTPVQETVETPTVLENATDEESQEQETDNEIARRRRQAGSLNNVLAFPGSQLATSTQVGSSKSIKTVLGG